MPELTKNKRVQSLEIFTRFSEILTET